MFDISWTEFLLIGVVALVVIGPKELPAVMRTMGQWTRKIRGMASDFQNQFQEAMREAEMADLKKSVDDLAHDFTHIDPLKSVRDDVESVGKDLEKSLSGAPEPNAGEPEATVATAPVAAEPAAESAALPAATAPLPIEPAEFREKETVGSPAPDVAAPGNTERTG
jgi:sec-independent protein translocase protein TatB